jgi:large repetitive protein
VTFTNGVTYDINTGLVTVPANVLTFEVTFPGLTDLIDELDETYTVSVGGKSGTGTILDDDAVTVVSVGDATEWEGDNLTHLVTLSTTADRPLTYPFSVTDVTATANVDYNLANVTFTNGVTYDINTGLVTVPANVLTFEVTFPA